MLARLVLATEKRAFWEEVYGQSVPTPYNLTLTPLLSARTRLSQRRLPLWANIPLRSTIAQSAVSGLVSGIRIQWTTNAQTNALAICIVLIPYFPSTLRALEITRQASA